MSVSLIAVFIPILLMGGIVGRLFREFSVTLAIAIVTSLVVSLTTTPAMCARFLRPSRERHRGKVHQFYGTSLGWVLRHPLFMLGVTVGRPVQRLPVHRRSEGIFPQQDTGRLMGNVQVARTFVRVSSQKLIEFRHRSSGSRC
jgi:multidrug efflux pump